MLSIPEFDVSTRELRLSGLLEARSATEGDLQLAIGSDGSLAANLGDATLSGQFSNDGSLFTALVVGAAAETASGCNDTWTAHFTGVKR